MTKKQQQEMEMKIMQLLFELELSDRITVVERIGKKLRQQNSREISKEVSEFSRKVGTVKNIDYSPVLKNK